jgi:hypothetical protein
MIFQQASNGLRRRNMSYNLVNPTTGDLTQVAGGTLYADTPLLTVISSYDTIAGPGWKLLTTDVTGRTLSRTEYKELFGLVTKRGLIGAGKPFGEGDGSTTFVLPDAREATFKGIGLTSLSSVHYDSDGVGLGEFIEDRVQDHLHRTRLTNMYFQVGGETVAPVTENGGSGIGEIGEIVVGRHGATTEVKSIGINYFMKVKQVAIPADFLDAVDDVIKGTTVDAVTNGDMNPVTSNAVYDEFKKVQPQTYECSGFLVNSSAGEITGYGRATVILRDGIAEIKFSVRIQTNDGPSTFNWGLNRDLLHTLIPSLPNITPIGNYSNLQFFAGTGAVLVDLMGYGAMASAVNQFWVPARMYQTDGSTGTWGSGQFPINSYITGTVYGAYAV